MSGVPHMKAAVRAAYPTSKVIPCRAIGYQVVARGETLTSWCSSPDRAWREAYKLIEANR